ncbi:hypothetical protein Sjap_003899 [Stephania japonica]|uniref:25S rRNA (uridine-N(3))-methyltransferase BMT5-like domain-containing protein n=1 Tax=Stephania japonica TaxID=461633 RepID=A0AAP0KS33_9MAGN
MGQVLSSVLNWFYCSYQKRNPSSPRLFDQPLHPQQNADHVITIVDDHVESFDDHSDQREYWSIVVDPDHDFPNQDYKNRGQSVPYEGDFEGGAFNFDDQVFTTSTPSEEKSPHSTVDDPKELSIVVDNGKGIKGPIPYSGDFDFKEFEKWSVVVDPDHDFPNQDQNRGELVPYEGDFEGRAFDDQVFTTSTSSEEQSPHSSVDDPKEVNPLSIVVDNGKGIKGPIPYSGDFDFKEFEKWVDAISRPIEEKKSDQSIKQGIWIKHYCSSHKILLVGEGDFSFSACLGKAFGRADNMVATSLNTQDFLKKNYGQAMSNIQSLRSRGCKVMHKVNATEMAGNKKLNVVKYDRIVYNFPHAGFSHTESVTDEVRKHQNLVSLFMANAAKMIEETGEIHISHKCNKFFEQWGLRKLAKKNGLVVMEEVKFNLSDYPGYNTKYGFGGDKNFDCNPSKTYKFRLKRRVSES